MSRGKLQHCGTGQDLLLPNRPGKTMLLSIRSEAVEGRRVLPRNGMARNLNGTPSDPPLGSPVPGWLPRQPPPLEAISGGFCRVEPTDSTRHGATKAGCA